MSCIDGMKFGKFPLVELRTTVAVVLAGAFMVPSAEQRPNVSTPPRPETEEACWVRIRCGTVTGPSLR